jgi:hypothetical protein
MMASPELSVALATLLRGPLHAEDAPVVWRSIGTLGAQLRDQLELLGMRLVVDETERFAYLRTLDELPDGMPRLARRHALTFGATVLLILLRQELTNAESDGETPRLIMTTAQMTEWMRPYRRDGGGEERINGDINTLLKLGYLRRLRNSEDTYEVRRIVKAIVTPDWLLEYRDRLLQAADGSTAAADPEPVDLEASSALGTNITTTGLTDDGMPA